MMISRGNNRNRIFIHSFILTETILLILLNTLGAGTETYAVPGFDTRTGITSTEEIWPDFNFVFSPPIGQGSSTEQVEMEVRRPVLEPTQCLLTEDLYGLNSIASERLIFQEGLKSTDEGNQAHTYQHIAASQKFWPEISHLLTPSLGSTGTASSTPAGVAFEVLPTLGWQWGLIALTIILGILTIFA